MCIIFMLRNYLFYICVCNYFYCNCDIYKVISINSNSNKYIKQNMEIIMHVYSKNKNEKNKNEKKKY